MKVDKSLGLSRHAEGYVCGCLGEDYLECCLKITNEIRDNAGEKGAYRFIENDPQRVSDIQRAIDYHEHCLNIAKELGDQAAEQRQYSCLGNAHQKLNRNYQIHLTSSKQTGDRSQELEAYAELGSVDVHYDLRDSEKTIVYYQLYLNTAKEVTGKSSMVSENLNLGNAYHRVGNFKRAVAYLQLYLKIVKDGGDRFQEAIAYADLGSACYNLGDFVTAIAYYERLMVAKEAGIMANAAGYIYNYPRQSPSAY